MEKILRRTHKNLMVIEAGFIYCKRHNLNMDTDTFFETVFMTDDFIAKEDEEFDTICKDLRCFRHLENYELKTLSVKEYELVVDEFKNKK